jgi:hypothetical protein
MTAIEELLDLHPANVVARFAAEPSQRPKKRAEKAKRQAPERRLVLRRWRTRPVAI